MSFCGRSCAPCGRASSTSQPALSIINGLHSAYPSRSHHTRVLHLSSFRGNSLLSMPSLRCSPSSNSHTLQGPRRLVTTAVIKRRKDYVLDSVIQREKKLKIVLRIKEMLVKQPGQVMSLRDLGKYRRYIGLTGKRRCIAMLNRFPAVFQVYEEGVNSKYFRFTRQARAQYLAEVRMKEEMEQVLVTRLRKLLMMSIDRRILVEKIGHIRRDLGLPDDFKTNLINNYPQYFRVEETDLGPTLALTEWDDELAITSLEKATLEKEQARKELEDDLARSLGEEEEEHEDIISRVPRFRKQINLPKGLSLKKKDREKLLKFQEVPVIPPYSDTTNLNPASAEAEKHALLVVHELLSLTIEKRLLVDHLTHFRRDFQFSQRVRALLIRHPEMFYVSLKGARDSVFLREAYENDQLKEKDPLVLIKERMQELVMKGKQEENIEGILDDDEEEEEEGVVDDDDWDEDEDEARFVGRVGNSSLHTQRLLKVTDKVGAPRERW